ncbi:MAG: hypothetical protein ACR5LD_06750 [Symbiopectobacterium sp.]
MESFDVVIVGLHKVLLVCFAPHRPDNADYAFCWWITAKTRSQNIDIGAVVSAISPICTPSQ